MLSIGSVTGGVEANAEITGDSPNQVLNLVLPKGDKGDVGETGPANTLSIGTVTSGVEASATITGSAPNQVLNLVLPKGDVGPRGESTASIVQTHTDLTNSSTVNIILDENISIYRDTTLQNTTYVFDTSNITFTDTDTITFELKITMATPYTITFPQNIKWMEDTAPSFSEAGIYYFVFRSDNKGVTWYGNIQGRWTI